MYKYTYIHKTVIEKRHLIFFIFFNDPDIFQLELTWSQNIIPWFTVYVIKQYDAQQLWIKDLTPLIVHDASMYS